MFKLHKLTRAPVAIICALVFMVSGVSPALAEWWPGFKLKQWSFKSTVVDVDCDVNPDVLLKWFETKGRRANVTFNITGACNGPLYITADGIRLVGADPSATIVLPAGIPNPGDGAVFADGAHDLRIQNLLIDATAWGSAAAEGSDAAGVYARNAFVRLIDSDVEGGLYGVNPFRNAILRMQGTVNISEFLNAGVSVGDQSQVNSRGQVNVSTTRTDGSYLTGIEAYRDGVADFRSGLVVSVPAPDESINFYPNAITSTQQSHVRIRNRGTVDISGPVYVGRSASLEMQGGMLAADVTVRSDGNVTLRNTEHEGNIDVGEGSQLSAYGTSQVGDMYASVGSVLNLQGVDQTDGQIEVIQNSTAQIDDSSVGFIWSFSGSVFDVGRGQFGGAEIAHGSVATFHDTSALGDIGIAGPVSMTYSFEGFGSLNGNTIYLCGTSTSNIDQEIADTGFVSDFCLP